VAVEAKVKKATAELKAIVLARGSHLMDIHGVGPVVAARVLADVGGVTRFADRNRFASWTGTAPLDASSGEQNRHRLSRAGNRRMNHMIHIAAISQIRLETEGRAYYRRKRADGKKPTEASRCLKRRISDAIYRQLLTDAEEAAGTGPGGHCGAALQSSAVDLPPHIDTSDQPLPGPAKPTLQPTSERRKTTKDQPLRGFLTQRGAGLTHSRRATATDIRWLHECARLGRQPGASLGRGSASTGQLAPACPLSGRAVHRARRPRGGGGTWSSAGRPPAFCGGRR